MVPRSASSKCSAVLSGSDQPAPGDEGGSLVIFRNLRTARTVLIASAAAGALVLSACGGSDAGSSSTSSTSSSSSAASSAESPAESAESDSSATESTEATESSESSAAGPTEASEADLAAAKAGLTAAGKLTVCTSLPYPPFEAADIDGNVIGFDMDFMDLLASTLGVEKSVVDTPFEGIQSGQSMASKVCDIAAAAMTITPERQAAILFSDPYYDASQALMVLEGSDVTDLSDLSGKVLGAQTGTTGNKYATDNAAQYGYTIQEFQNISDEELALQSGQIQAGIHDEPALAEYVKQQAGAVKVVKSFDTGEQYGFGMALDNTALAAVTNAMLAKSRTDGTYDASYDKWVNAGA